MSGLLIAPKLTAAAALIGVVAGCSPATNTQSVPEAGASTSAASQTKTAEVACDRFYDFDLFRRVNVARMRQPDGGKGKKGLQEYLDLASRAAISLDSAVTVGDLPPKTRANADRIVRMITGVSRAGGGIRDVTEAVEARIGKSADRIEQLCMATNQPVPRENLDAREKGS